METLTYLEALILGLVQGLGEFLPISSSGHLALLQYFFEIEGESVLTFAVLLHLGTLVSVIIVYFKDLKELIIELGRTIKDIFTGKGLNAKDNPTRKLGFLIVVGTIPTAIIGFSFKDVFEGLYLSLIAIGAGLIFTGIILFVAERVSEGRKEALTMKYRSSIFIGIMQGIAIIPGVSRSGSTLFAGLITGQKREFAVKYAFLLSIPAILGSVIVEAPDAFSYGVTLQQVGPILLGMAVAAVSGYIAIKAMIKLVSKKKLSYFSFYTWALGISVLVYGIFFA